MRNKPVTTMNAPGPSRANAGWQTLTAQQFAHFNGQVQCYQCVREHMELIPSVEWPQWLQGFLSMLMNQFKSEEIIKAA